MTTIRDIARTARVSVGTVSNFLNNPDLVADDTRQVIQQTIERLGYHPRAAARSLKAKKTYRIGLVPLISLEENHSLEPGDTAFLEFLSAVNTAAAEHGYDILLAAATSQNKELTIYRRLIGEVQVDGLILMGIRQDDERVRLLLGQQFPFITFGQTSLAADHPFVDVDGVAGMQASVDHLVELGHRRIAYLTPPPGWMCTQQRWQGFQQAMASHNLPVHEEYVLESGFSERAGQVGMHLLLDLPTPPTAVILANDLAAFGAMRALQMRGLQAGQEVSIVGFDDITLAAHWNPSLTTIAQPFRKIGFAAVEGLLEIIAGTESRPQICIQPKLVVRQSTGPVRS